MRINKLTASFGKLSGDTLELKDGLNIISAPNESGKSTWCAFIRAMLYGIDSTERAKAGYLPDKQRYAPWSGAPMQGEMEVTVGDKNISISRETRLKTAPMREFSAVYTGTNIPVEGMTGANAGEILTGATKEVFRRSAMIEQGQVTVSGSPELEKRITAIVSTGDEDCSFAEADEQLRAWQRKRRYNRRGKLVELEQEMAEKEQLLAELQFANDEKERLTDSLCNAKEEVKQLEEAVNESRKTARKEALANLQATRIKLGESIDAHEAADEELDKCRSALEKSALGDQSPDSVEREAKEDLSECNELREAAEKRHSPALAIICLVLAAATAVFGLLCMPMIYIYIAAAVLAVLGAVLFVMHGKAKKRAEEAAKARRCILNKYEAEDEAELEARVDEFFELYDEFVSASENEAKAAKLMADARKAQENAESTALTDLDFSSGDSEAAQLSRELMAAQQRSDYISDRISEMRGKIQAMGDPLVIGSELSSMKAEHREISGEFDAISLAVDVLREADTDIQSRFSPVLGQTAANYMSLVTGGKYESILINRDFSAKTKADGDTVPRQTEYLSAGTLDLMYLAVRLAVCEMALPEDANCPLILDDTLVNLDNERTQQAMKLLEEIAKTRQVILFTCR